MARIANRISLKLKEAAGQYGTGAAYNILKDALKAQTFRKEDISLLEMAGSFMGEGWEDKLTRFYQHGANPVYLRETADAVDASQFVTIGGQLLIDMVRDMYKFATQISDKLITVIPTGKNLGTHIEPWLSYVLDEARVVEQLQPFPFTQFTYQYVTYPAPVKKGEICAVGIEMIQADKTQQAFEAANSVGLRAGLQHHKDRMRVILGIINNHSFNGTGYNTYQTASPWINKLTDFVLQDWKSVNRIEQLFNQMQDPVTGEVIDVQGNGALVMPFQKYLMKRILSATETRSGNVAGSPGDQVISPNPLENTYTMYVDKHSRKLLVNEGGLTAAQADTVCIFGDFKKAFVEREVVPMTTIQAAPNNIWEFTRDIALAVRVKMHYVVGVRDPRYVVYGYNSSAT